MAGTKAAEHCEHFAFDTDVLAEVRAKLNIRVAEERDAWTLSYHAWRAQNSERAAELDRILSRELPANFNTSIPSWELGSSLATRKASGEVINAIATVMPEFWGGSADLAESNNTTIEGGKSFLPTTTQMPNASPYGRIVHFGIREHAMGAALNGMSLSGLTRPFGGTFFVFSDYMRGAVRLAALMQTPVTYVWTHDSVGLGEDGPTHQPIEHLWSLRAMPGLSVVRPADANETAAAWHAILHQHRPVGLVLTRQNVPTITDSLEAIVGLRRGAYVIADHEAPEVLLLATGSEVQLALSAHAQLAEEGIASRVISMPCLEWFDEQDLAYRDSILLPSVRARVSVEAGATLGWWKYVGDRGRVIGIDHFGASASDKILFQEFGITTDAVIAAAKASLNDQS